MNNTESNDFFIVLIFLVATLGMAIPYGFPLFSPLIFLVFLYYLFTNQITLRVNYFIISFYLCIVFYFLGIIFNDGVIYQKNIGDIQNIFSFIMLIILLSSLNIERYKRLIKVYFKLLSWLVMLVSMISFYKYFKFNNGIKLKFIEEGTVSYPYGTSLINDYNMFSFALGVGIIASIYNLRNAEKLNYQLFYYSTIIISAVSMFLSGSRRGWIVLAIILAYFIFRLLKLCVRNKKIVIISLMFMSIVVVYFAISFNIKAFTESYNFGIYEAKFNTLISNDGFSSRNIRWIYAFELFSNYDTNNLFFGKGFNYLKEFADYFPSRASEDYPHSPILSSFLYSGLFGGVFCLAFYFTPIYKLFIYKKFYNFELLLLLCISLAFSLISGNSLFSNSLAFCLIALVAMKPIDNKVQEEEFS